MKFFWLSSTNSGTATSPPDDVIRCDSAERLTADVSQSAGAVLILDIRNDEDRERSWPLISSFQGEVAVWIHEPSATVRSCARWIKAGVTQVVTNSEEISELISSTHDTPGETSSSGALIGRSWAMRKVAADVEKVAARRCSVLLEGETGTGKEVVARAVHSGSSRSRAPWVAVNCGAIPETLLEAELFGHVRGAFTGAVQARAGKFEAANHGTIFLDEIGDMPIAVQSRLLRVLQEREVERLGGNERIRLDVRVIAATNVDLADRVRLGLFRQDLFYRLNVFRLELPPLRDRMDDIPALASHFVRKVCLNERLPLKQLDGSTTARLLAHNWPGNVRELENAIEAAVVMSGTRSAIYPADLRLGTCAGLMVGTPATSGSRDISLPHEGLDYHRTLEEFEKSLLTQALARVRGNKTAAADLLRMKRTTLAARMRVLETRLPRLVA